jgi:hypothetical protein
METKELKEKRKFMKSTEKQAKAFAKQNCANSPAKRLIAENAFIAGYEHAIRWITVEESLPEYDYASGRSKPVLFKYFDSIIVGIYMEGAFIEQNDIYKNQWVSKWRYLHE